MSAMTEPKALALLIRNVKSRSREIDLLSLAEASGFLEKLYGSREAVAARLSISTETLRVYSLVRRLPERVKSMVHSRLLDSPEIVEVIDRVRANEERQIELAQAVVSHNLSTKDAREIEKFARDNPDSSTEESVSRVLRSRPMIERRYLIFTELPREASIGLSRIREADRRSILEKTLGVSLMTCDLRGGSLLLLFEEQAFVALTARAKQTGVSLEDMIDEAVSEGLVGRLES
jgi:hypothetical protein